MFIFMCAIYGACSELNIKCIGAKMNSKTYMFSRIIIFPLMQSPAVIKRNKEETYEKKKEQEQKR